MDNINRAATLNHPFVGLRASGQHMDPTTTPITYVLTEGVIVEFGASWAHIMRDDGGVVLITSVVISDTDAARAALKAVR